MICIPRSTVRFACVAMLGAAVPAYAGSTTDWHQTMGGDVRLVIESTAPNEAGRLPDTVRGAIEIKLASGWHTYWRDPGASGIPPTFVLSDTSAATDVTIDYPAPVWVETDYGSYAGYKEPIALPFRVETGGRSQVTFSGELILGVCEDICIPVVVPFDLAVAPSASSSIMDSTVAGAFGRLPDKAPDGLVTAAIENGLVTITVDQSKLADYQSGLPDVFAAIDGMNLAKPKLVNRMANKAVFASKITYGNVASAPLVIHILSVHGADAYKTRFDIPDPGKSPD